MSPTDNRSTAFKRAVIVIGVLVFSAVAWSGFKVWSAWSSVETVAFDPNAARDQLGATSTTSTATRTTEASSTTSTATTTTTLTEINHSFLDRGRGNTFLVIGSDESTTRADVILLVMLPPSSGDAIIVSIPRDLWVRNPCYGTNTKINANLFGCEGPGVSGPEQLAVAIEDFTGVPIDHFVMFTFEGFTQIIDRVGGVEVCVGEYPIRDLNRDFDNFTLPAGCSTVDGEAALSWMRSRKTQQKTDAGWVGVPNVSDLTRNERQQDMMLTALDEMKQIRSLPELQGLVEDIAEAFIIDEGLGLADVIGLLWDSKTISSDNIYRVALDVRHSFDEVGGAILLLESPFPDAVIGVYPRAFEFFPDWAG